MRISAGEKHYYSRGRSLGEVRSRRTTIAELEPNVVEQTLIDVHIGEEVLELYALGRLAEPETERLEEHLLLCELCQEELAKVDDFVRAFRIAAPAVEAASEQSLSRSARRWLERMRDGIGAAGYAAPALATAALALVVMVPGAKESAVSSVDLRSERGDSGIVAVSAGKRLHLTMDMRGLPEGASYRVELADSSGAVEWSGPAALAPKGLTVTTAKAVVAGRHWVRVYATSDGAEALVREFGVNAR